MANPHRGRGMPLSHTQESVTTLNGAGRGRGIGQADETNEHAHMSRNGRTAGQLPHPRHTVSDHVRGSPTHVRGGFRHNGTSNESQSTFSGGRGSRAFGRGSFRPSGRGSPNLIGRGSGHPAFAGGRGRGRDDPGSMIDRGGFSAFRGFRRDNSNHDTSTS